MQSYSILLVLLPLTLFAAEATPDRTRLREELKQAASQASALSRAFNLVHELSAPSVVAIHTREQFKVINRSLWEQREEVREVEVGEGSGFVFHCDDAHAWIATNAHVVSQTNGRQQLLRDNQGKPVTYDRITVSTNDNNMYDAEVVGIDVQTDLAVLRITAVIPAIEWADSDLVKVGDWALAEGHPFGKGYSATAGIVSATDRSTGIYRSVGGFEAFIQTDAAINPGNSGGPLFDINGRVVGVNSNIISPTGTNAGLGFAIPANLARRVAEDLMDDGKLARPMIGVELRELTAAEASSLGPAALHTVQISKVIDGSPAQTGGLKSGDVIVSINDLPIANWQQFRSKVAATRIGHTLAFRVWREGKEIETMVEPMAEDQLVNRVGMTLQGFGMLVGVDDRPGLVILNVSEDGLAARAELRPGDRLLHERSLGALTSIEDASTLAERREIVIQVLKDGKSVWLRMRR